MASRLLFRPLSPFAFRTTLCASSILAAPLILQPWRRPILLDTMSSSPSSTFQSYKTNARTPVVKNGKLNPSAVKQISTGSILGLVGGVGVSMFSTTLAILIGLLVCGVQFLETRGIHLVPYSKIQGYVKNVDVRSAVQDNVAFKMSFGITFALAAFAKF